MPKFERSKSTKTAVASTSSAAASSSSSSSTVVNSKPTRQRQITHGERGLQLIAKQRIMEMISSVEPIKKGLKLIIFDKAALSVINTCCSMYDILQQGVSLAEPLHLRREPLPKMEAIYFVSPCAESVSKILDDFDSHVDERREIIMYRAAHVFFTSSVSDDVLSMIRGKRSLMKRLRTLKELNLDFLIYESQFYHTAMKNSFDCFFPSGGLAGSSSSSTSQMGGASQKQVALMVEIARRVGTLCVTLGERPLVFAQHSSPLAQALAERVDQQLHDLHETNPNFPPKSERDQASLFIIDRSFDASAPLLHEFTYGAMCYDLLDVDVENASFTRQITTSTNEKRESTAILDAAKDSIWAQFRNQHIDVVRKDLVKAYKEFIEAHKKTKDFQQRMGKLSKGAKGLQELSEVAQSVPHYQDMIGKYSLHISLASALMDELERRYLIKLARVEQDLVMGTSKNPLADVEKACESPTSPEPEDIARLLGIYAVSQSLRSSSDLQKLLDKYANKMSAAHVVAIQNLPALGIKLSQKHNQKARAKLAESASSSKKLKKSKRRKNKSPQPYEISRYTPELKFALDDYISAGGALLPNTPFTTIGQFTEKHAKIAKSGGASSSTAEKKANRKSNWAKNRKSTKSGGGASDVVTGSSYQGGRIIVFVVGGATMSELRAVHELIEHKNYEIYLGSTHLLTPSMFLEQLSTC